MKKVLSFSLFGNNDLYTFGAIENAKLSSSIYNDWETRFYVGDDVNTDIIDKLKSFNVTVIICKRNSNYDGLFWRFKPFYDNDVDIWISRDCDSRISYREKSCIEEWLKTDKPFHIMRDSHNHGYEIMAGMFGINNNIFSNKYHKPNIIIDYSNNMTDDQTILKEKIWSIIEKDHLCHDYWYHNEIKGQLTFLETDTTHFNNAYGCGLINYLKTERKKRHSNLYYNLDNRDFPKHQPITYGIFVGQKIDENNKPIINTDTRWEYELRGIQIV